MQKTIIISLLSSVLLLPTAQAQQKLALVIGNSNYSTISFLKNAVNDADDIASKLKALGFNVVKLKKNLRHNDIKTTVRKFGKRIQAGDIVLFYYAGHGVSSHSQNYLIPLKADIEDESDLPYRAINANWVLDKLQLNQPALKIMILDACRDNPFRGFRSASRGLARMNSNGGTIIAYAADEGQKASDGTGRNGLYTQELLKLLGQSGIQASQMFSNVSWKVSKNPNSKGQTPFLSMKAVPPFCFAGCTRKDEKKDKNKTNPNSNNSSHSGNAIINKPKPPKRLSYEPEMQFIKGGRFQMGSPASEKKRISDEKQHSVQVGDFWMAKTETTFDQWQACVDDGGCQSNKKPKDEGWGRGNRPVINVSWHDANEYANWLSKKTGKNYRLPTEAQWEFAARAGRKTAYAWGNKINCGLANYGYVDDFCKTDRTKPVASYKAYAELYDMHGNVREWTCSAYDKNYGGSEKKCAKRNDNRYRVLRGGSWSNLPRYVRSANRYIYAASYRYSSIGFRLSRTN